MLFWIRIVFDGAYPYSAHERRRRSIVQHMIRHYQSSQPFIPTGHLQLLQVPAEQLAQFRTLYRYHWQLLLNPTKQSYCVTNC